MELFLYCVMIFLMLLASVNLFVGVSNDAVNFMSSAIGSKAAPFRHVLFVASAGVLLGCTFSSGMMEIARSGIFNPQKFTYAEIMIVFFAVMITDVILLDMFNSLGLPTSTTVSIVFELLGASVITAGYKLWTATDSFAGIGAFINTEKALTIIIGILVSVIVAFTCGLVIQWILRMVFTFKYKKVYRYFGGLYAGFCLTAIFYFLIMKGAKGSSFMTPELMDFLSTNSQTILLVTFGTLTVFFQLLIWFFNFNALRVVILAGTFALSFAFAGNDLVNFVGVPIAALQSTQIAEASGLGANELYMTELAKPVVTPTFLLLIAGLVMVATLFFSRKAQRVVQTAINLSSSERSEKEQFGSSISGRVIVRSALKINKVIHQFLPASFFTFVDQRLEKPRLPKGEQPLPFDQVRASVNLVVASILIASATTLQLPLSTTYVTFMVGMGSSLADGAWDRETAVYRITGVLAVISGWFLTAFTAFIASGFNAWLCLVLGPVFMVIAGLIVIGLLVYTNFCTKTPIEETEQKAIACLTKEELRRRLNNSIGNNLQETVRIFSESVDVFLAEDYNAIKAKKLEAQSLLDKISFLRSQYFQMVAEKKNGECDYDARNYYYRTFSNMKDVAQFLRNTVGQMEQHLANSHSVFEGKLRENLLRSVEELASLQKELDSFIRTGSENDEVLLKLTKNSLEEVNVFQLDLMKAVDHQKIPLHRSELYLSLLQFSREVVNRYTVIVLLQRELNMILSEDASISVVTTVQA
jgi:phosphate/sulfate permease